MAKMIEFSISFYMIEQELQVFNFWLIHFFEREKSTKMAMMGSAWSNGIKGWNKWVIYKQYY
jgi:hypothetical protein